MTGPVRSETGEPGPVTSPPSVIAPGAAWQTVLLAIWMAWVSNFMVRTALAPGLVGIRAEFGLSHAEGGLLATAFLCGYCVMLLPGGLLGDRFGRRRMVLIASFGWAAASLLIGLAPSYFALALAVVALGVVMGWFNANDRPTVAAITPRSRRALGQGLSYTGVGMGSSAGLLLGGVMTAAWGWRSSYFLFALLSLAAAFALWRAVPTLPAGTRVPLRETARLLLGSRDLWLLYASGIPSVAAAWLLLTWAPTILLETGETDLAGASLLASGIGLAGVPALVGTGLLSDSLLRRGRGRKSLIAGGHALLAVSLVLFAVGVEQRWAVSAIAALMFLVSFAQWMPWAPTYALLGDLTPPYAQGFVFGLGATCWVTGAIVIPWLAGAVRDWTGSFLSVFQAMGALSLVAAGLAGAIHPAFRLGPERRFLGS